jgi:ribosomal protein S18 acetylase RimI-like enzyme
MSGKLDSLYRLQKRDIPQASAVLTDAFQHDPIWKVVLRESTLEQKLSAFETPVRYCLKYGEVYAPSEKIEGVAAWVPGSLADMTFWRVLRSGAARSGVRIGAKVAREMRAIFQPIEVDRKENMRGKSFIYILIIWVAPSFQGQGFGGKLLRALIEKSEQLEVPIYLETETESNVSMYEHFGFEVVKEIVLPVINLPMWEMVRQ